MAQLKIIYNKDTRRNSKQDSELSVLKDPVHLHTRNKRMLDVRLPGIPWMLGCVGLLLLILPGPCSANDFASTCNDVLGMQSGEIPDSALTASSSYDPESVGPENARVRTETKGGAWCPQSPVSKDSYEWLQIDLGELIVIRMVETQGRFGYGQGQEYAEQYLLSYQREDGGEWFSFHNRKGQKIIQGNMNTYISEMRELDPPIVVRRLRFIPYSAHPKTVCMRVELYGCKWHDGSVWYAMPQGERRGSEVDLYDLTYDGEVKDNYLLGGMGQLSDREEGHSNFRLDPHNNNIKGYEWMGWRNESFVGKPVEIVYKFDTVRNFSSVKIHANNFFSKDVRVFQMARIYMSIGGKHYLQPPIEYQYMRDELIEFARTVRIKLDHKIGRYVKIQLFFDSKWMMISEIEFSSEPAIGTFLPEVLPTPPPPDPNDPNVRIIDINPGEPGGDRRNTSHTTDGSSNGSGTDVVPMNEQYIGMIIGVVMAVLILLIIVMVCLCIRRRHLKYNNNHRAMKSIQPPRCSLMAMNLNDLHHQQQQQGPNAATINNTQNGKQLFSKSNGQLYNCVAQSESETSKDLNGDQGSLLYKLDNLTVAQQQQQQQLADYGYGIQGRKLPEPPARTPGSTDTCGSRDYAIPSELAKVNHSLFANPATGTPPPPYNTLGPGGGLYGGAHTNRGLSPPTVPQANTLPHNHNSVIGSPYACADVVNLPNTCIQGVSGNTVYAVPNNLDLTWKDDLSVMEFPRENLHFVEKLGEGQFGEVHLGEASGLGEMLGEDFLINRLASSQMMLVAIKTLRRNADDQARADFHKEVKIMCGLKDPNIVRVLGVCSHDEPLCVIVEYMKYGDLNQFLQQHVPSETVGSTLIRNRSAKTLSPGCLTYMASQIASGMKYLETLNMVHRDLATRNCLVGPNYTIKISDFGMSRSLYSADYYRIEGRAVLPIRWMAWESILLGKFSTKSDVWSFGVTMWEILTFARHQPYEELSDEAVIDNCNHFYRNDGLQRYLPQPEGCPREIFDLVHECWNTEESYRPTFREIHMFMQRKNMGYNPRDDAGNSHVAMV